MIRPFSFEQRACRQLGENGRRQINGTGGCRILAERIDVARGVQRRVEHKRVAAGPAVDDVVAGTTRKNIVAAGAVDGVGAFTA